jgi:hypothetical protein
MVYLRKNFSETAQKYLSDLEAVEIFGGGGKKLSVRFLSLGRTTRITLYSIQNNISHYLKLSKASVNLAGIVFAETTKTYGAKPKSSRTGRVIAARLQRGVRMPSHRDEPERTNPNYLKWLSNYNASGKALRLIGKAEHLLIALAAAITIATWLSGKL